jgi:hypothetical protein
MFGRWAFGCWTAAALIAGLAIGTAALNAQLDKPNDALTALSWVFVVAALLLLVAGFLSGVAFVVIWCARFVRGAEIPEAEWRVMYWLSERRASVGGIRVKTHEWMGKTRLKCQMQIGNDQVYFSDLNLGQSHGDRTVEIPQHR